MKSQVALHFSVSEAPSGTEIRSDHQQVLLSILGSRDCARPWERWTERRKPQLHLKKGCNLSDPVDIYWAWPRATPVRGSEGPGSMNTHSRLRDGHPGQERQFKLSILEEPTSNHHGNTEGESMGVEWDGVITKKWTMRGRSWIILKVPNRQTKHSSWSSPGRSPSQDAYFLFCPSSVIFSGILWVAGATGGGRKGVELASCLSVTVALFNRTSVTLRIWPFLLRHCSSRPEPNWHLPASFPPPNPDSCCSLYLKYLLYLLYLIVSILRLSSKALSSSKLHLPSRNNSHPPLCHLTLIFHKSWQPLLPCFSVIST